MTLLEIYEQWINGNKTAFFDAVKEYGIEDFLIDIIQENQADILTQGEVFGMACTIKYKKAMESNE